MIIKVHPHELELIENEKTNEKESYVSDFTFEFDDEITSDFTKEAFFTKGDTTYKVIIQNNRCDYPQEVLQEIGYVDIGVSAFKVVDNKTIRYNPTPITKYIDEGSLKEAENSVPVTPTDKEQMEQMLSNINIKAEKVGTTTTITITNTDGESQEVEILDGEKGSEGPQGEKGRDGREFHAMVGNTETLPEGSEATVSINEDEENDIVYYNFGIPKGDKGDKGDIGDVDIVTFDVIDGKLIMYSTREHNYTFQLNDNKMEVVYNG